MQAETVERDWIAELSECDCYRARTIHVEWTDLSNFRQLKSRTLAKRTPNSQNVYPRPVEKVTLLVLLPTGGLLR